MVQDSSKQPVPVARMADQVHQVGLLHLITLEKHEQGGLSLVQWGPFPDLGHHGSRIQSGRGMSSRSGSIRNEKNSSRTLILRKRGALMSRITSRMSKG